MIEEKKLESQFKRQRRLEIKAIEFDWIFDDKRGAKFIKTLSTWNCIDVFSVHIIKWIILFSWQNFKKFIMMYLFVPYVAYFLLFILYTTYFHKKMIESGSDSWEHFGIANSLSMIFLIPFIWYFTYLEIRQIMFLKYTYFLSIWNLVDVLSIFLNLLILLFDLINVTESTLIPILACAVLLMWLKLFYFGRIFLSTASVIKMIIAISSDMKYFLLILMLTIAGFGNWFMILARNYDTKEMFTGNNYWRSFLYSYRQALGDFNTDAFSDTDEYYLYAIWVLNTMVTLIIFLNLLIAIMGDTFDRVQEASENNMLKELACIMAENEMLFNRSQIFGNAQYIIVIEEEKADGTKENWEGKLLFLKSIMDKNVAKQKKLIDELMRNMGNQISKNVDTMAKSIEANVNKGYLECIVATKNAKSEIDGRYSLTSLTQYLELELLMQK